MPTLSKIKFADDAVVSTFFEKTGYHWNDRVPYRYGMLNSSRNVYDALQRPRSDARNSLGFARRHFETGSTYVRIAKFNALDINTKADVKPGDIIPLFTFPQNPAELSTYLLDAYNMHSGFDYLPKVYNETVEEETKTGYKKNPDELKTKVKNQKPKPANRNTSAVFTNDNFVSHVAEDDIGYGLIYVVGHVMTSGFRNNVATQFAAINFDAEIYVESSGEYTLRFDSKRIIPAVGNRFDTSPNIAEYFQSVVDKLYLKRAPFWRKIKRIIINNVNCMHWESFVGVSKDTDDNFRYLKSDIYNVPVIITNGSYESVSHFNSKTYRMSREDLIKKWSDAAIGNLKSEVEEAETNLLEAKRQLMSASKAVGEKRKIMQVLSVNADAIFTKAMADIEHVPGIDQIEFEEGYIVATTGDVYYDAPKESHFTAGPRAYIGKFRIYIGILHNVAFMYNLHMSTNQFPHPHCGSDNGDLCSGGFETMIASALEVVDYQLVLSAIMELLRTCTEDDFYGRTHIVHFKPKPPKAVRVSHPIKLYGDMKSAIGAMTLALPTPGLVSGTDPDEEKKSQKMELAITAYEDDYDGDDEDEDEDEEDEEEYDDEDEEEDD